MLTTPRGIEPLCPSAHRGRAARAALLSVCLALPGLNGAVAATTPDQPLDEQEAELRATEQRLARLRDQLTDRERYRDALHAELERAAREVNALMRAERELDRRLEAQDAKVADLVQRLVRTGEQLDYARNALTALVRSAYLAGPGDRLRLMLDRQDLGRVGRQLGYYRALAKLRAARVAEAERLAAELHELKRLGERESEELATLAERQRRTREALQGAQGARSTVLAVMEQAIDDDRARVAELDASAAALRKLVQELRERAKIAAEIEVRQEAITRRFGKLPLPAAGAKLVRGFGGKARPGDLHADGLLFELPPGSEVFPVHHGQVIHADWLRGFGLLLVIDHGDGYMSFYGHNQALLKEVGEWVGPDDVIALSGAGHGTDTGPVPGPGSGAGAGPGPDSTSGSVSDPGSASDAGPGPSRAAGLPLDDLRTFAEVFGRIKSDYVETTSRTSTTASCSPAPSAACSAGSTRTRLPRPGRLPRPARRHHGRIRRARHRGRHGRRLREGHRPHRRHAGAARRACRPAI
jgi:septal ring factor EnvC (AmiA/AmiB activator)